MNEYSSLEAYIQALRTARAELSASCVNHAETIRELWSVEAERDAARLEVEQVAESRLRWYENFRSMANQRDAALADVEKLNNIVDKWMKAYESVREEAAMYHTQRDEADETADFWEAQFDDAQANLAKAYAELSNRTLDSLDSDDAIGSEPLLVVFTFGGLD